jgi:signal transduction histidine kinase
VVAGLASRGRPPRHARDVVERVAERAGADPRSVAIHAAGRALGHSRVLALPPHAAIEALLEVVAVLAPVAHVSLWRRTGEEGAECVHHAGTGCPPRTTRDAARRSLGSARLGSGTRGLLQVVPVPAAAAVLVARPCAGSRERSVAFLRQAAAALAPALQRAYGPSSELPAAQLLASASERRVARIGFDLHDGPVQTLAALLGEARRVQCEVSRTLDGDPHKPEVMEAINNLKTLIVALEFELRTLCHSLESPTVLCKPFERVVEQEIVTLQRQTGARPAVELSGRFEELTPSQRIALLRVVQEALRNVREHSSARAVAVRIHTRHDGTRAVVENNGPGFDVPTALARAVRDGRVGLIGMMERIRLLGGTCEVQSCAKGPTTVSVSLPRWEGALS